MAFRKFKAFESPDTAVDFNAKTVEEWSVSGRLNGFEPFEEGGVLTLSNGSFIQDGIVVVEDDATVASIPSLTGTAVNPAVFYAVASGDNDSQAPVYAFALRNSLDDTMPGLIPVRNYAVLAYNDGTGWKAAPGVSILELLKATSGFGGAITFTAIAATTIAKNKSVYVKADGTADLASSNGSAAQRAVAGIAMDDVLQGDLGVFLAMGIKREMSSLSRGSVYYLGTNGDAVTTPALGFPQIPLGVAVSTDAMVFHPDLSQMDTYAQIVGATDHIRGLYPVYQSSTLVTFTAGKAGYNGFISDKPGGLQLSLDSNRDGSEDPVTGLTGSDSKMPLTWYYAYLDPKTGQGYLSTASHVRGLRAPRIMSLQHTSSVTLSSSSKLYVTVNGTSYTCSMAGSGGYGLQAIADNINTAATWLGGLPYPPVRAYLADNERRLVLVPSNQYTGGGAAVGALSTLRVNDGSGSVHAALKLTIGREFLGKDWLFMGVVYTNSLFNIYSFTHDPSSGLYTWKGQNIQSYSDAATPFDLLTRTSFASTSYMETMYPPVPAGCRQIPVWVSMRAYFPTSSDPITSNPIRWRSDGTSDRSFSWFSEIRSEHWGEAIVFTEILPLGELGRIEMSFPGNGTTSININWGVYAKLALRALGFYYGRD